jgi:hypothetical protein
MDIIANEPLIIKGFFQCNLLKNTASNPKPAKKQRKILIIGEIRVR